MSSHHSQAEVTEGDLAGLLSAFGSLNVNGDGGKDVEGVLESLMGQLMSKEILYEPLKELHQKVSSCFQAKRPLLTLFSVPGIHGGQQGDNINRRSSPLRQTVQYCGAGH